MFAFMGSICCHGKLEDSGAQLESSMRAHRGTGGSARAAPVPAELPCSGASPAAPPLPNCPTRVRAPGSAKSVATGSTRSLGHQIHSLREKRHFSKLSQVLKTRVTLFSPQLLPQATFGSRSARTTATNYMHLPRQYTKQPRKIMIPNRAPGFGAWLVFVLDFFFFLLGLFFFFRVQAFFFFF